MGGKRVSGGLVFEKVRNVRQVGASWLHGVDDFETLFDGKVSGMWPFSQGIDDQAIKAFE